MPWQDLFDYYNHRYLWMSQEEKFYCGIFFLIIYTKFYIFMFSLSAYVILYMTVSGHLKILELKSGKISFQVREVLIPY